MPTILISALTISVSSVIWIFIAMLFGLSKHQGGINPFCAVALFEIAGIWWGLRRLSIKGTSFLKLVGYGSMIAVLSGFIISVFAFLFTAYVFPQYFSEMAAMYAQQLAQKNLPVEQTGMLIEQTKQYSHPNVQAIGTFMNVSLIGVIVSILTACWVHPHTSAQAVKAKKRVKK